MHANYHLEGKLYQLAPIKRSDTLTLSIDGHTINVSLEKDTAHSGVVYLAGQPQTYYATQYDNSIYIHLGGRHYEITVIDEFNVSNNGVIRETQQHGDINAPMPGVVEALYVQQGQTVSKGDSLLLIESMKLQTEIKATMAGIISAIHVELGSSFEKIAP